MAGNLVKGNWRGRRRTPLALPLKKAKLTSPENPFFGTVSSVQHRGSDSIQSYCLKRKGGDMYVQSISH